MSTEHFYRELKPFHSFVDEAFDGRHYVALPADWLLIVADITEYPRFRTANTQLTSAPHALSR